MSMITAFENKVYAACARIRRGNVSTYAEIAKAVGRPRAARAVGNALNKNRSKSVPCHRVVCSNGTIGGFAHGSKKKCALLREEGLEIKGNRLLNFSKIVQGIK